MAKLPIKQLPCYGCGATKYHLVWRVTQQRLDGWWIVDCHSCCGASKSTEPLAIVFENKFRPHTKDVADFICSVFNDRAGGLTEAAMSARRCAFCGHRRVSEGKNICAWCEDLRHDRPSMAKCDKRGYHETSSFSPHYLGEDYDGQRVWWIETHCRDCQIFARFELTKSKAQDEDIGGLRGMSSPQPPKRWVLIDGQPLEHVTTGGRR